MSRTCVALLLLGLASPAVATATRTATPASWTLVSGDSTIDGRTGHTAVFNLVPRVVRDTAEGVDSPRVVDRVRATVSGPVPVGLAAGLANWPTSMYCDGPRRPPSSRSTRASSSTASSSPPSVGCGWC